VPLLELCLKADADHANAHLLLANCLQTSDQHTAIGLKNDSVKYGQHHSL